jgi:hypothetical protein
MGARQPGLVSVDHSDYFERRCVWQTLYTVQAYQRLNGLRIDLIVTTVGLDALIFCFDVALTIHAVKTRRTV